MELDQALAIATQIAQGLEAAHRKGVVHRDIKPANIMGSAAAQSSAGVKILDFGLAQLAHLSKITKTDSTVGTVAYMAPEQTKSPDVDHRADIWSLGDDFGRSGCTVDAINLPRFSAGDERAIAVKIQTLRVVEARANEAYVIWGASCHLISSPILTARQLTVPPHPRVTVRRPRVQSSNLVQSKVPKQRVAAYRRRKTINCPCSTHPAQGSRRRSTSPGLLIRTARFWKHQSRSTGRMLKETTTEKSASACSPTCSGCRFSRSFPTFPMTQSSSPTPTRDNGLR